MPKTLLCFLLLLVPVILNAQEFKTPAAKDALTKYKAECQKAEIMITTTKTQYRKGLNVAMTSAIKESKVEGASRIKKPINFRKFK